MKEKKWEVGFSRLIVTKETWQVGLTIDLAAILFFNKLKKRTCVRPEICVFDDIKE